MFSQPQAAQAPDGTIYALCRGDLFALEPNGDPDLGFGEGGVIQLAAQTPPLSNVRLAVDSHGRPVVAGTTSFSDGGSLELIRYLPDGAPDPSFGNGGVVITDLGLGEPVVPPVLGERMPAPGAHIQLTEVAIDRFDRFVITGGHIDRYEPDKYGLVAHYGGLVARLGPEGEIDRSYGEAGVFLGFPSEDSIISTLASEDSLFAAGQIHGVAYVIHLGPDGDPDPGFGADGWRRLPGGRTNLVADGKDGLIIWRPAETRHREVVIRRLQPSGALDRGFGNNGVFQTDFGTRIAARLVAPDGTGGFFLASQWSRPKGEKSGAKRGLLLARLTSRGQLDRRFGRIKVGFGRDTRVMIPSLSVDRQGRPLLAGAFEGSVLGLAIARYRRVR